MTAEVLPPTMSVPEFGDRFCGLGRDASYNQARAGLIPAKKVGRKYVVPMYAGLKSLGWPDHMIAKAMGIPWESESDDPARSPLPEVSALTKNTTGDQHAPHDAP